MSESSRLGSVVEIGDLSDDQALRFLVERQLKNAKQILDFTGGRMRLLKLARTNFVDKKKPIEGAHVSFHYCLVIIGSIKKSISLSVTKRSQHCARRSSFFPMRSRR